MNPCDNLVSSFSQLVAAGKSLPLGGIPPHRKSKPLPNAHSSFAHQAQSESADGHSSSGCGEKMIAAGESSTSTLPKAATRTGNNPACRD
jgi:hypothetical protein